MMYAGMRVLIKGAQEQRRTAQDIPGPWVRPRCKSKRHGRRGTRRAWKRQNPPHRVWLYREPDDVLVLQNRIIIATPRQAALLRSKIGHNS